MTDRSEQLSPVDVRPAGDDELGELAALRWRWVDDSSPTDPKPDLDTYRRDAVGWARAHRETHLPFAAVSADRVVGMAWLALLPRVPTPSGLDRLSGDLQSCYVIPEYRGLGLGRRLASAVLAEAAKRGLEHVTVHASPASVPMYQRAGFEHHLQLLWHGVDQV